MRNAPVASLMCFFALAAPVAAQWIKYPTKGLARYEDGKPNLEAPAPQTAEGTPSLSGVWRLYAGAYNMDVAQDLKPADIQPWARALFEQRSEDLSKDHMSVHCLPFGPAYMTAGGLAKIVQTPDLILILNEDLTYRQIFLDGRPLESDPNPSWMGYSVGRWEGDTLVVESAGFNARTWLDYGGHPHTEALRIVERIRRKQLGQLDVQVTFADERAYARPWSVPVRGTLVADTELLEYVCAENEKSLPHLVGKASDDKRHTVVVSAETLAAFAGTYEFRAPSSGAVLPISVTVSDGQLVLEMPGRGKLPPLTTMADGTFQGVGGMRIEFVKDGSGSVGQMIVKLVEGEFRARRKQEARGSAAIIPPGYED